MVKPNVLLKMGIDPGIHCIKAGQKSDQNRLIWAEIKFMEATKEKRRERKKRKAQQEDDDYGAGEH